jgi:gamma-glutamyl-gamma-aminobutyrate hydrolase PuuD
MTRPLIGITTYVTQARFGAWDVESALVPADYVHAVERAGGRALLVPPSAQEPDPALDALDGLVLSGGSDLDPALYGQEPHAETRDVVRSRDDAELALLRDALDRDLPVLAICRGSQVLNVLRGGDLVQHLPESVGHDAHKQTPGSFADHEVRAAEGFPGERGVAVKSHHHQGFGRVGAGLEPVAWAEDGTVEALVDPERRFAVGVLWHPEAGEDAALFEALVAEARAYREARG